MKALRRIYARLVFHPTLLWNLFNARVLKRWNWWDLVDDVVIIGALPSVAHVEELKTLGVVAVVNTCAEYHGPVVAYETAGIDQLSIPTVDYTAPTLENVQKAVDFIQRHADEDGMVYVHCKAGRARSATIVVCWLMQSQGMTPDEAQAFLKQRRDHVHPRIAEREVVKQFHQRLTDQPAGSSGKESPARA